MDAGSLTIDSSTNSSFTGIISGSGEFSKRGPGQVILGGASTYSGPRSCWRARLMSTATNALPIQTDLDIATEAKLILTVGSQQIASLTGTGNIELGRMRLTVGGRTSTYGGSISGEGSLSKIGNGELTLAGQNTYSGSTRVEAGSLIQGTSQAIPSASPVTVGNAARLDLGNFGATFASLDNSGEVFFRSTQANVNSISGNIINQASGIVHGGDGVLELSGNLKNLGTWNADRQELILTLGGAQQRLDLGGQKLHHLTVQGGATIVLESDIELTGRATQTAGTLDLNSRILSPQLFTLENGRVIDSSGDGYLSSALQFELHSGELNVPITSSVGLKKTTTGTVSLGAMNRYVGPTNIEDGRLTMAASGSIPNNASLRILQNGVLDLNTYNLTLLNLEGAGQIVLSDASLTLDNSTDQNFAGNITGSGGIHKTGTGRLRLAGNSSFFGATRITTGTLDWASPMHCPRPVRSKLLR